MATYYVDPTGNDTSGNGSAGAPWKTLKKATTAVTAAGDLIHLNAGSYPETQQSNLAVGVSLEGPTADPPVAIVTGWAGALMILQLLSASAANGAQEVRYVHFQSAASYGTSEGMRVEHRHNVKIHHCKFSGFDDIGLSLAGYRTGEFAGTLATGIEIADNVFDSCSKYQSSDWSTGAIQIGYTSGAKIHDNYITAVGRGGHGIKYWDTEGYNHGLLIYNNEIHVDQFQTSPTFRFAIELWNSADECRIYDNTLEGEINVGGAAYSAPATYSVEIAGNTIYRANPTNPYVSRGISTDSDVNGLLVHDNTFYGLNRGFFFNIQAGCTVQYVYIYRNVFHTWGTPGLTSGGFFLSAPDDATSLLKNLYIWNNVFDGTGGRTGNGLDFKVAGANATLQIVNNVFLNCFNRWCVWWNAGSWSGVVLRNNDRYGNGGANAYDNSAAIATITVESGNNTNNPGFTAAGSKPSPYYLPSGAASNLVDAGYDVGLSYSGAAPDIGAYEYQATPTPIARYLDPAATGSGTGLNWANAYTSLAAVAAIARDLVANNEAWTVHCRSSGAHPADPTAVTLSGWTTSAACYLKVVVDAADRQAGRWDDTRYRLTDVLTIEIDNFRLEGVQIGVASGWDSMAALKVNATGTLDIRISHCIVRRTGGAHVGVRGVSLENDAAGGSVKLWNCLIYGFSQTDGIGLEQALGRPLIAYNNTIADCAYGVSHDKGADASRYINNLVADCPAGCWTDWTWGWPASGVSHNASDDDSAPGSDTQNGEAGFVAEGTGDYHLAAGDAVARGHGTSLAADGSWPFSDDIDGTARAVPWDIGADKVATDFTYAPAGGAATAGAGPTLAVLPAHIWGTPGGLSWALWKLAGGATADSTGPAGLLLLESGQAAYSDVRDLGSTDLRTLSVLTDHYGGEGSGSGAIAIRGAETSFAWDAGAPAWQAYTGPLVCGWRYVQLRLTGA